MYHKQIFIDKEEFKVESLKSQELGQFTEKLGYLMLNLVRNIVYSSKFKILDRQEEVRYELEMYILERLLTKYLISYNPDRGSGFALATSITRNIGFNFLKRLKVYDATGNPKYFKHRNAVTNKRDRIIRMYINNSVYISEIY